MRCKQTLPVTLVLMVTMLSTLSADTIPQIIQNSLPQIGKSDPAKTLPRMRKQLFDQFEGYFADMNAYRKRVEAECRGFPEGDLFPYVFPVYAYTSLVLMNECPAELAQKRIVKMIEFAIPGVVRDTQPPFADLTQLQSYKDRAYYLGHLNLALACYERVGGDDRYARLHDHISELLLKGLAERKGKPLVTEPVATWPFETVECMLSLRLHDEARGTNRSDQLIKQHIQWLQDNGSDPNSKLPYSFIAEKTSRKVAPRGCALSWRVALMAHYEPQEAKRIYQQYTRHYWRGTGPITGFAEWPTGVRGFTDVDSGPIIMGVGSSATVLGVGAATAMGDQERLSHLCAYIEALPEFLPLLVSKHPQTGKPMILNQLPYDKQYYTGFLFGDATLFHAITWTDWSRKTKHE